MSPQAVADFERRWGAPGPAPNPSWRCCYRCGEWQPPGAIYWCLPHRLCRSCSNDGKRGIWRYTRAWHRKNRWDAEGRLIRLCVACRRWKRLEAYYRITKRDPVSRSVWDYPSPECADCTKARVTSRLSLPQFRAKVAAR